MSPADGGDAPATRALLAVPGDPSTPTGGYGYARALLEHAPEAGLILDPWPLPEGFPHADAAVLEETAQRLSIVPAGWPVIVDGLALGVLPPETIRAVDAPVIALCHHPLGLETGLSPDRATALMASERAALAACAGVVATSETTARLLARDFDVPRSRLAVARPGTARPEPRPAGRRPGPPRLLSVGSLTPRKGHDVLVAALSALADLDWELAIVGPEDRDPACAAALRMQIAEAGLSGRVTLTGAASGARLAELYADSDVFVLASRLEGYGMAYAEAIAHGLPVVGTEAGAVAEATLGAARLVPPDDPAALAAALRPLLAEPEARAALAAAAAAAAPRLPRWTDTANAIAGAVARLAELSAG